MNDLQRLRPMMVKRLIEARLGIRVSRTTFYRWLGSGRLQGIKYGKHWWVSVKDVENFIEQSTTGSLQVAP